MKTLFSFLILAAGLHGQTVALGGIGGGGGGGTSPGAELQSCTVAFNATLVVDLSATSGGNQCASFLIGALTANVTSFSITNPSLTRGTFWTTFLQDSMGGRTISGVAGDVLGMCTIDSGANKHTWIAWEYDGTNIREKFPCGTDGTPTTLPVANGGTGATTLTNHGVVVGAATSAVNVTSAGTAGQVLTSNGASADPTFQAASGGTKLYFGFDFRNTSGYAADPAYAVFVTDQTTDASMVYPKTFTNALNQSIVCGWSTGGASVDSRDRVATSAQFQAGMNYLASGTALFRCDLPATGYYQVITVWGDPTTGETVTGLITDNGTTRITVTGTTTGSATEGFVDSASKVNAIGFWQNTPVGVNFTSTVFGLVLAPASGNTGIIHLRLIQQ